MANAPLAGPPPLTWSTLFVIAPFVGVISVGYLPIWIILFPIATTATIAVVNCWNRLAPTEPAQYPKGVLLELSACLGLPRLFCAFYLGLILVGGFTGIFVFAFSRIPGVVISPRQQETVSQVAAAIIVALAWVVFYWGIQTLALRRFTRGWQSLFVCSNGRMDVSFRERSILRWFDSELGLPLAVPFGASVADRRSVDCEHFLVSQRGALFGR